MQNDIEEITEKLHKLPIEKLVVVNDFISYLLERQQSKVSEESISESTQTMIASENVLSRDWNRTEEDEAWANL